MGSAYFLKVRNRTKTHYPLLNGTVSVSDEDLDGKDSWSRESEVNKLNILDYYDNTKTQISINAVKKVILEYLKTDEFKENKDKKFERGDISTYSRLRLQESERIIRFKESEVFTDTCSLHLLLLPKHKKDVIRVTVELFSMIKDYSEVNVFNILKAVSNKTKIWLEANEDWVYFCELSSLSGFILPQDKDVKYDDISGNVEKQEDKWSEWHYQLFERCVNEWCEKNIDVKEKREDLSLEEFVSDFGRWAVTGASNWEKDSVFRNKTGTALKMSTEDIINRLYDTNYKCINTAFFKNEAGKVSRVIYTGDMKQYLLQTYIMDKINFIPTIYTSLFQNANSEYRRLQVWESYFKDKRIAVPLDFKAYDTNVTIRMIKIMLKVLINFSKTKHFKQLYEVYKLMIDSIELTYIQISDGSLHKWENGLLSGWKMTGLIGTITSYSWTRMAKAIGQQIFNLKEYLICTQGDDVSTFEDTKHTALQFIYIMVTILKRDLSIGKFYFSETRIELLRKQFKGKRIISYPTRIITKILYRSPEKMEVEKGPLRMQEGVTQWLDAKSRGYEIRRFYLRDLKARSGLNQMKFEELAKIPYMLGGVSLDEEWGDEFVYRIVTLKDETTLTQKDKDEKLKNYKFKESYKINIMKQFKQFEGMENIKIPKIEQVIDDLKEKNYSNQIEIHKISNYVINLKYWLKIAIINFSTKNRFPKKRYVNVNKTFRATFENINDVDTLISLLIEEDKNQWLSIKNNFSQKAFEIIFRGRYKIYSKNDNKLLKYSKMKESIFQGIILLNRKVTRKTLVIAGLVTGLILSTDKDLLGFKIN